MLQAPHPDEARRLDALNALGLLDTPRERPFDEIAGFAARICSAPVALVSLLDRDRQWFKAAVGAGDLAETPRSQAICAHAVASGSYLEISDTATDPRTADNPLVTGPPHYRFYAGALLKTDAGAAIGTLCVLDHRPRELSELQRETLEFLAGQVMRQVELRRAIEVEEMLRAEIDHRVKNSLQTVASILRVQKNSLGDGAAQQALTAAERRINTVSLVHNALYQTEHADALDLADFLPRVTGLLSSALPPAIRLSAALDPVTVGPGAARALAMIVSEFVANSAKHAFDDGARGEIRVTGTTVDSGYHLKMSDTGRGLPDPEAAMTGGGIGLQIVAGSAEQIGATARWGSGPDGRGTALDIMIPAAAAPDD